MDGTQPQPTLLSYTQYKEDTNYIAAWLADTSRHCGYQIESLNKSGNANHRLKGKAKDEARANSTDPNVTPRYKMRVADFVPMAQTIATFEPKVHVPGLIDGLFSRAIRTR
jgi:hypothetical protein